SDQGLDDRAAGYVAASNIADDLPYAVTPLATVVFAASADPPHESPATTLYIESAVVLTVVAAVPDPNSFRPGICAYTGRASLGTLDDCDFSMLESHTYDAYGTDPVPTLHKETLDDESDYDETVARIFRELRIDWLGGDASARQCSPWRSHATGYGRDVCSDQAVGFLMVNSDATPIEKRLLAVRLVQYGIDLYATAKARLEAEELMWVVDEGHVASRLVPMVYAAAVLQSATMTADLATIGPDMPDILEVHYIEAGDAYVKPYTLYSNGSYQYSTGTVTVTNGSAEVVGDGANWPAANPGETFFFGVVGDNRAYDETARVYTVETWTDATHITLSEVYDGETGSGKTFKLGDMVHYGHARALKIDSTNDAFYDSSEMVTWQAGFPNWRGRGPTEPAEESTDYGDPETHNQTYRFSGQGPWAPNLLALYMMGLDDEFATAAGDSSMLDYVDSYQEFCRAQHDLGLETYADGYLFSWYSPVWAFDEWSELRGDYGTPWTHEPSTPSPEDEEIDVALAPPLTWVPAAGSYGVRIYLDDETPLTEDDYVATVLGSGAWSYQCPSLDPSTTYYWRADYVNQEGLSVPGEEWSFTTGSAGGIGIIGPMRSPIFGGVVQ
ncbi:MAG: hypothetical protein ABFE01_15010, partial [Phycisphaerales bacterium]